MHRIQKEVHGWIGWYTSDSVSADPSPGVHRPLVLLACTPLVLWGSSLPLLMTGYAVGWRHKEGRVLSFSPVVGIGTPQPLTHRRVWPPYTLWFRGEGHTRWRERGWESPNSDEGTYTVVLFIYMYFVGGGVFSLQSVCQPIFMHKYEKVQYFSSLYK